MSKADFTTFDYELLLDLYVPFDRAFPHLENIAEKFFFNLGRLMQFDSPQAAVREEISQRCAAYILLTEQDGNGALALLSLSLSYQLRRAGLRFPNLSIDAMRLLYEILNSIDKQPVSFEEFAARRGCSI